MEAPSRRGLSAILAGGWRTAASRLTRPGGIALPLMLLWVLCAILVPSFLTTYNLGNLLLESSTIGVLALGSTVVILTEEIDLSIGAVEGMTSCIAAIVIVNHHVAWPLGLAAAIGLGFAIGFLNGAITTISGLPSFVVTLGMMGMVEGLALKITSGQSIYNFPSKYQYIGQGVIFGIDFPVYLWLGVFLWLYVVLRFSRFGWHVYATGGLRTAADEVGIRTRRVRIAAFAISGACAGLAGVIVSGRLNSGSAIYGESDLLTAIAAVVIGGASLTGGSGSVVGTTLGVLLISTVQNTLNLLNVSPFWQQFTIGAIIVGAATLGQMGRRFELRRRVRAT